MTAPPRNLWDLFLRYQMSPEAQRAASSTKAMRAAAFDAAIRRFGGQTTLRETEERGFRSRLYDWRDSYANSPSTGTKNLALITTVFNWAVDREFMRDNPAAGMKQLKRSSRADIIWAPETFRAFREAAHPALRDLADFALWTGLRQGDVAALRAFQFDEGWLRVTPQKTIRHGINLHFPYHLLPPLAMTVVRVLSREMDADAIVLEAPRGGRWNRDVVSTHVKATLKRAGRDTDLHFNDLRGTLITWLLNAGCTDAEVGSISGHSIAKGNMRSYAARTRALAENAYMKLAAHIPEGLG
jgi:integrase